MTPKEKAKDLVDKMYGVTDYQAKQSALIAVDEILSNDGFSSSIIEWDIFISYWQEVKQEIKNL